MEKEEAQTSVLQLLKVDTVGSDPHVFGGSSKLLYSDATLIEQDSEIKAHARSQTCSCTRHTVQTHVIKHSHT